MLVMAFAVGLTVLRQTHAIWDMDSPNAVVMNSTLNTFTGIEPLLIIVVLAAIILAAASGRRGF